MEQAEFRRYLNLDEDDLHAELGAALLGKIRGFSASDEDRFRRQGKKWFSSRMKEIRERLCPNAKVRALYEGDNADRVTDASALVDALAGMAGHPIPTIIAALVIKYGLRNLCHNFG